MATPRALLLTQIMRLVVNGIHWAAAVPIPDASIEIKTLQLDIGA